MEPRESTLDPGRNCWRIEQCSKAALVVDAADYFRLVRKAMMQAKKQIFLIGWDFDTRITLDYEADDDAPKELGAFLSWLPDKQPGLHIYMLKWDLGAIKLLGRGTTALRLVRWALDRDISFKLDGAHPAGASHHHKIAVLDDQLAFCGGIDMTADRWDTRGHVDCDDRRKRPTTRRRYPPWHDAAMAVAGDVAQALGDLARQRWEAARGSRIAPPSDTNAIWPDELSPTFENVRVAISRTRAAYDGEDSIREIEALFLEQIGRAERFIYIENQYFASRAIVKAIGQRLTEEQGPEFVIINPKSGQGWLDDEVMSTARAKLMKVIEECDKHHRFRIYTPVTAGGEDIYVHSKIMIVDDRLIRVGSANLNNRSMGLDSECDLTIDSALSGNSSAAEDIGNVRAGLLAEHLGVAPEVVHQQFERCGSLIATVEALRGGPRTLLPFVPQPFNKAEDAFAESELLDPESAGEQYEAMARPGLMSGVKSVLRLG